MNEYIYIYVFYNTRFYNFQFNFLEFQQILIKALFWARPFVYDFFCQTLVIGTQYSLVKRNFQIWCLYLKPHPPTKTSLQNWKATLPKWKISKMGSSSTLVFEIFYLLQWGSLKFWKFFLFRARSTAFFLGTLVVFWGPASSGCKGLKLMDPRPKNPRRMEKLSWVLCKKDK